MATNWRLTYGSVDTYYDTLAEALEALPTDGTEANIYSETAEGMSDIIVPEGTNVTIELSGDDFACDEITIPEDATLELTLIVGATLPIENDITCDGAFTFNIIDGGAAEVSNNVIVNESAVVNINIGNEDTNGTFTIYSDLSNYSSDFNIASYGSTAIYGATKEYGHISFASQGSIDFNEFYMYASNTYNFGDSVTNIPQLYVADGVTAEFKTLSGRTNVGEAYDMHGNELTPEIYQEGAYYITKYVVAQPQPANITLDLSTLSLPTGTHSIQIRLSDDGLTKRDSELSNAVTYVVLPQLATPQNPVAITSDGTDFAFEPVENAESYEIFADGDRIGECVPEPEPTGETWVINEVPNFPFSPTGGIYEDISFISNNESFSSISIQNTRPDPITGSISNITYDYSFPYNYTDNNGWSNQNYRTVYFPIPPTGDLRTWLNSNAELQQRRNYK